jgi:hypothetical protein
LAGDDGGGVGDEGRFDQFLAEKFKFHSREEWRQRILAREVCIQPNASRVPSETPSPVRWVEPFLLANFREAR